MIYRLIGLTGSLKNQRITVAQEPMTIGRDPGCAVAVPDDEEIAREHARIEHRPEGLFIRDLGSMNKVLVNKREVHQARLKHGDMIELGRTRFLVRAVVQAEVDESSEITPRRKQWRAVGAGVVAVLIAVLIMNHMARREPRSGALNPEAERITETSATVSVSNATSALAADEVSEDLKLVRKDLAAIRETMKSLTNQQTALASDQEDASAVNDKMELMLQDAANQLSRGQVARADQLLASIQLLNPDFLPAYEQRAKLFERRGMMEDAIDQWSALLDHDPDPDLFQYAVGERLHLRQQLRRNGEHRAQVKMVSVEQHKVLPKDDYREMRILKVTLEPKKRNLMLEAGAVRLEIEFFDEDLKTGKIFPTAAAVNGKTFTNKKAWGDGQQRVFTAAYAMPKTANAEARYCGYVVRLYYNNKLQDVRARPKTLLARSCAQRAKSFPEAP